MERFAGKIAVVTGSSGGIGSAICKELMKYDVIVVGLARRLDKLEKLAEELSKNEKHGKFYPLKCDLAEETDIENSFQWITSKLGPIAILINNAGAIKRSLICDVTAESITKMFDVNVKAAILCSNQAVKSMTENAFKGHIVNINSMSGHRIPNLPPSQSCAIYSSSKHALTVISEGLRRELVSKNADIKVTNLSPGLVHTEMAAGIVPSDSSKILQPKDVADACIAALNTPPDVVISQLSIIAIRQNF